MPHDVASYQSPKLSLSRNSAQNEIEMKNTIPLKLEMKSSNRSG